MPLFFLLSMLCFPPAAWNYWKKSCCSVIGGIAGLMVCHWLVVSLSIYILRGGSLLMYGRGKEWVQRKEKGRDWGKRIEGEEFSYSWEKPCQLMDWESTCSFTKRNIWNQLFTVAVLSEEDTVGSSMVDSQMAALRKDGSRHDNGFILIACDQ